MSNANEELFVVKSEFQDYEIPNETVGEYIFRMISSVNSDRFFVVRI